MVDSYLCFLLGRDGNPFFIVDIIFIDFGLKCRMDQTFVVIKATNVLSQLSNGLNDLFFVLPTSRRDVCLSLRHDRAIFGGSFWKIKGGRKKKTKQVWGINPLPGTGAQLAVVW